ncbi:hypothetical protein ABLE68_06865 [Nocardioides sp. CN2-186]|uniref:hypothetical protein n=1 Tax=Nocardioides tweenelious TaxID=3156607 RepID=UPI0032B49265
MSTAVRAWVAGLSAVGLLSVGVLPSPSPRAVTAQPSASPASVVMRDPQPPRAAARAHVALVRPAARTFRLHTRARAAVTIYLDFTGSTTENTRWNEAYTGGDVIDSTPFDLDGDPTSWSTTEDAWIQQVWLAVAEDFSPFAVDVTTQPPGTAALRYGRPGDPRYGVRVVISPDHAWYSTRLTGGVAQIGSTGVLITPRGVDEPAFVFATGAMLTSATYLADAASHEVGHTFGLWHDGVLPESPTSNSGYTTGNGTWGPLMGAPYADAYSQWSNGDYPDANNHEDDLDIIAAHAGRAVDEPDLRALEDAGQLAGTISAPDDVDRVQVVVRSPATVTLVLGNAVGPPVADLEPRLVLRDPSGAVLASQTGSGGDPASVELALEPGRYLVEVSGAGDDQVPGYGSLGR